MSSKPWFFCERQVVFFQYTFLIIPKYFTSSWEDEAALCSSMVVAISWWDKQTWRTIKSSMVVCLPWLLYLVERELWLLQSVVPLCFREKSYAQDQLVAGRSLLDLLGAMLSYKEPVTPSPKRGTLSVFSVFSHIKRSQFSISLLLFHTWRSLDNICRV